MNVLGQMRSTQGVLDWEHVYDEPLEGKRCRKRRRRRPHSPGATSTGSTLQGSFLGSAAGAACELPEVDLTRHAAHRMKNRGISMDQVLILTDFGRPQRVHGATRYALDRPSRDLLYKCLPAAQLRGIKTLDIVAVVSDDGSLVTAAHRTGRLRRKVSRN